MAFAQNQGALTLSDLYNPHLTGVSSHECSHAVGAVTGGGILTKHDDIVPVT